MGPAGVEVPRRLLLVDTVDRLPGLLPWHAYEALRSCDLIVLGRSDHPMAAQLDMAEERYEILPADVGEEALGRTELLAGLSLADKARASWVIDRVTAVGSCAYVHGPGDTDAFTRTLGMEAVRAEIEVEVVYFGVAPKGLELLGLVAVQQRLLAPDGCPWDAEQTHATLAKYAVEEVFELAEAIAAGDDTAIAEELGDVLMQVTFHAELSDAFDIDTVAAGIAEKLVRRHPHVFGDGSASTASEVEASWEDIKSAEKPERTGPFAGVPAGLPAMALAAKVQSRAGRAGVEWPDAEAAAEQVADSLGGAMAAEGTLEATVAVGQLLFDAVALARAAGVDPEDALRRAVARFREPLEAAVEVSTAEVSVADA